MIDSKLTSQLAGAKVRLSRVSWNSKVNTTMIVDSTLTDNLGHFNFKLKDGGAYSILAEKDDSLAALSNSFEAKPDSGIKINLKLKKRAHLKGRVILPFGIPIASIRIFIVGHSNVTSPDSEGVYELPNLPQGKYSIVFSTDLLTNYLPIDFKDEADDDVFIEDVAVNEIPDSLTEDLPPPAGNSSDDKLDEVDPVQYPLGQEPSWYKDKLFNEVIYLDSNRTRQTIHCEVVVAWNPICL